MTLQNTNFNLSLLAGFEDQTAGIRMASTAPLELAGAVPLQRQRSMQSNIMFIQEEHAKTLKALHEEIRRLQTKCSELTFSVAMGTTSSPQEGKAIKLYILFGGVFSLWLNTLNLAH